MTCFYVAIKILEKKCIFFTILKTVTFKQNNWSAKKLFLSHIYLYLYFVVVSHKKRLIFKCHIKCVPFVHVSCVVPTDDDRPNNSLNEQ